MEDAERWIETCLVKCLLDCETLEEPLGLDEIRDEMVGILGVVRSASNVYPIGTLALGLAASRSGGRAPVSLLCARESIEGIARARPAKVSLSRGTRGSKAEFISFQPGAL